MHKSSLVKPLSIASAIVIALAVSSPTASAQNPDTGGTNRNSPRVQRLPEVNSLPKWVRLADVSHGSVPAEPIPFSFEFSEDMLKSTPDRQNLMPPVLKGPAQSTAELNSTVRRLPQSEVRQIPKTNPSTPTNPAPTQPQSQDSPTSTAADDQAADNGQPLSEELPAPATANEPKPDAGPKAGPASQPNEVAADPGVPTIDKSETSGPTPTEKPTGEASSSSTPPTSNDSSPAKPLAISSEANSEQKAARPLPVVPPEEAPPIIANDEIMQAIQQQIDIQQQQIDTLQKMMKLTANQIVNRPEQKQQSTAPAIEKEISNLANIQQHAAARDIEIAREFDSIRERIDSIHRNGLPLPSTAREHFMPTRSNESPITHYGQLAINYADFENSDSEFATPVYFPRFLAMLNESILLDVNPRISIDDFELVAAQIDWFATDNLTISTGRFFAPFGFFNERLQFDWVRKSVDVPLMFNQVFPAPFSVNGISFRGAAYPTMLPVKFEYAGFAGNGVALNIDSPSQAELATLSAYASPFLENNNDKSFGGRIGLSYPEMGVIFGLSGMTNGAYDNTGRDQLDLWGFDFSLNRGNWDFRFELIQVNQQAASASIDRNGWYSQLAYRDLNSLHPFWQKFELLGRVDSVDFDGIDLSTIDLNSITRENQPVDRHRWTIQANYYVHPSFIVKAGYQLLDEHGINEMSDNGFLAQVVFGF